MKFFATFALAAILSGSVHAHAQTNLMGSTDIVIDVVIKRPIGSAWAYWTNSAALEKWLTAKANVTPVLGGNYELFWDPGHPEENSTIGCRIVSIIHQRLLAFEWKGPVPFADIMNVNPLPTRVVVTFEKLDDKTTALHLRHSGWGIGEHWQNAKDWQNNAWQSAFEELKKVTLSQ